MKATEIPRYSLVKVERCDGLVRHNQNTLSRHMLSQQLAVLGQQVVANVDWRSRRYRKVGVGP